ncbi:MAG: hypothetical protein CMJ25_21445 [Phycisphaerae bacterium]|nr:hypothetical protein [Phycisphaerae bacterium]|tara:strand:+ start:330 stop:518 length:189 start_codon:yes stop_codon:yes gene_type:complete
MIHTFTKMKTPQGEVVDIPDTKVEKHLNRGWELAKATPTKTKEPEMVQEEDSHEEIENEEEA